jgi:hypothetical protein
MINKLLHYTAPGTNVKCSSKDLKKQDRKRQRHEFLLTFFNKSDICEHKLVNGFVLNKYFSKSSNNWEVMVYTQESWKKAENYLQHQDTPIKTEKARTKFQNLFNELSSAVG